MILKAIGSFLLLCLLVVPASALQKKKPPSFRHQISTQSEFDTLKRIYYRGRFASIPHLMFVIDRNEKTIAYVNSNLYTFHTDFVFSNYWSLERGAKFFEKNYLNPNRRFILGTLAYQTEAKLFTFEFWEGDLIPKELVEYTFSTIQKSFFAPIKFKPNSLRQEQLSDELPTVPRILISELEPFNTEEIIHPGETVGILRLRENLPDEQPVEPEDIVIFKQVPISVTPISGIVTTRPGTPLSHLNLLSKTWNIPNVFVKDADEKYKALLNKWVRLKARNDEIVIEPVDVNAAKRLSPQVAKRLQLQVPRADLSWNQLTDLAQQRSRDVVRFGAKSANLGQVAQAKIKGVIVPPGFTIPFACYVEFAKKIGLEERVLELLNDEYFHHDPKIRKVKLAELRAYVQTSPMPEALKTAILEKVHREFPTAGLFVRSSTNAEDLPNFNGAGLYTTVPNVKGDDALIEAVKTVWASIWNFEAFEAREAAKIDHLAVYPAVLLQTGINAESAGVMITTNPFDPQDTGGVYINAKRGLGIKVVEGQKIPEQIIFSTRSNAVRVLSRSGEDSLLTFDQNGGVKEIQLFSDRAILTDANARRLSAAALKIKHLFNQKEQDIEWALVGDQVYILQSRPYIDPLARR